MIKTSKGEYALKFTYNAMCEYEERFKRSLLGDLNAPGFAALRGLVWAGLIHIKSPAFTLSQIGEMIEDAIETGTDLIALREEIIKAIGDATFTRRLAEMTEARHSNREKA